MFRVDNLTKLLIGKDIARTAGVQITDPGTAATYIADGEILILDQDDSPLTPGDTFQDSPVIKIIQGKGAAADGLKFSSVIDGRNIISVTGTSYRAPAEQVSYVGYNSVAGSGSIDVAPLNDYKLTINYKHDKEMWSEQLNKRSFYYTSTATDTQEDIVDAFIALIEASEFYEAAVVKVTDGGGNFGIEFTGQPLDWKLGDFEYNKMLFDIQLSGFGTTPVATTTDRDLGQGVYEQIAELEWFTNGSYGVYNRVFHPAPLGYTDAVAGETYDVIAIEHTGTNDEFVISGTKPSRELTLVALPDTASQTTDFLGQLNPWIATTVRQFPAIAV